MCLSADAAGYRWVGVSGSSSGFFGAGVSGSGDTGVDADGRLVGVFAHGGTQGIYGYTESTTTGAYGIQGGFTTNSPGEGSAAVYGNNDGTTGNGYGVYGTHAGGGWGGYFTSVSGVGVHADGGTGVGVDAVSSGSEAITGSTTSDIRSAIFGTCTDTAPASTDSARQGMASTPRAEHTV